MKNYCIWTIAFMALLFTSTVFAADDLTNEDGKKILDTWSTTMQTTYAPLEKYCTTDASDTLDCANYNSQIKKATKDFEKALKKAITSKRLDESDPLSFIKRWNSYSKNMLLQRSILLNNKKLTSSKEVYYLFSSLLWETFAMTVYSDELEQDTVYSLAEIAGTIQQVSPDQLKKNQQLIQESIAGKRTDFHNIKIDPQQTYNFPSGYLPKDLSCSVLVEDYKKGIKANTMARHLILHYGSIYCVNLLQLQTMMGRHEWVSKWKPWDSAPTSSSSQCETPRILMTLEGTNGYNQRFDTKTCNRTTELQSNTTQKIDPLDPLAYCKRYYPATQSVRVYQIDEVSSAWFLAAPGRVWKMTWPSLECVQ